MSEVPDVWDPRDVVVTIDGLTIPGLKSVKVDSDEKLESVDTAQGRVGDRVVLTHATLTVVFTAPPHLALIAALDDKFYQHAVLSCTVVHPNRVDHVIEARLTQPPDISEQVENMADVTIEIVGKRRRA